ncbi:MAG: FecR family protein [Bdellovibrionales bacterium]
MTFVNGDSMMLGPGSALSLAELKDAIKSNKSDGQIMNLIYGKVRSVISKTGPRQNMRIKTKSAVAGVRGTDFFVAYNGAKDATEISVLRGKVAVNTTQDLKKADTKLLKKGYTAEIKNIRAPKELPSALPQKGSVQGKQVRSQKIAAVAGFEKPISIRILSKEKLQLINTESTVKMDKGKIEEAPPEVKELIDRLEKKAVEVVVEDIKANDPEQFKKIENVASNATSIEMINSAVINDLETKAPIESEARKLSEEELLRNLKTGDDVYQKYFGN